MRIVLIVALSLVGLAVLVTAVGFLMPRDHVATSEITLRQPVDSVYAAVRDIGGMTKWWGDLKVSERVTGAAGERWRQESGGFKMELDVTDDAPPSRFTTHIVEEKGAPFGGVWHYSLSPLGQGARLTIREEGWVGPPPFRVMATVMGRHRTMDGMLVALGRHFGEEVKPLHK